jgi:hypothetical protein
MSEEINLYKEVYGQNTYKRVVDTQFTQLVQPTTDQVEEDATVERFFELYEQLFFQIPLTGEINSHEYLVNRSSEYLGGSVITDNEKALIQEINSLRQQLLEANTNLIEISKLG